MFSYRSQRVVQLVNVLSYEINTYGGEFVMYHTTIEPNSITTRSRSDIA